MLQSQVNYWTLIENRRHNLEAERQGRENVDINRYQATSGRMSAEAAVTTSVANLQNAATNKRNADTNERNAAVNEYNALVNKQNADTAARNADINAWNAATNEKNATSNRMQAEAAKTQAVVASQEHARKWRETMYSTKGEGAENARKQANAAVTQAEAALTRAQGTYMSGQAALMNAGTNIDQYNRERHETEVNIPYIQAKTETEKTQQGLNTAKTWEAGFSSFEKGTQGVENLVDTYYTIKNKGKSGSSNSNTTSGNSSFWKRFPWLRATDVNDNYR